METEVRGQLQRLQGEVEVLQQHLGLKDSILQQKVGDTVPFPVSKLAQSRSQSPSWHSLIPSLHAGTVSFPVSTLAVTGNEAAYCWR